MAEKKPEEKQSVAEKVTIRLPITRSEKDDVYVAVNGVGYLIQRGKDVEVPASVAEVLRHREEMLEEAMLFEEKATSK